MMFVQKKGTQSVTVEGAKFKSIHPEKTLKSL